MIFSEIGYLQQKLLGLFTPMLDVNLNNCVPKWSFGLIIYNGFYNRLFGINYYHGTFAKFIGGTQKIYTSDDDGTLS